MDPKNDAIQEDHEPKNQDENGVVAPLFIKKKALNEEMKMQMIEEVESMREAIHSINEMWEAMSIALSQRMEASVEWMTAHLSEAKKQKADSFTLTPGNTPSKIPCKSKDDSMSNTLSCLVTPRQYYEMWSADIKRTVEVQRKKTRQSIEKWFEYLHRFDDTEQFFEPSSPNTSWTFSNMASILVVIVLCAVYAILSFGPDYTEPCKDEFLGCFQEKIMVVLIGIYNFYLGFHNITLDNTEVAGIVSDS